MKKIKIFAKLSPNSKKSLIWSPTYRTISKIFKKIDIFGDVMQEALAVVAGNSTRGKYEILKSPELPSGLRGSQTFFSKSSLTKYKDVKVFEKIYSAPGRKGFQNNFLAGKKIGNALSANTNQNFGTFLGGGGAERPIQLGQFSKSAISQIIILNLIGYNLFFVFFGLVHRSIPASATESSDLMISILRLSKNRKIIVLKPLK